MKVRDLLSAPFVLRSESLEKPDGRWIRVVSYPELDCEVEATTVVAAMEEIELVRLKTLLRLVEEGAPLPQLRDPVRQPGLEQLLSRAGLSSWLARLDEEI